MGPTFFILDMGRTLIFRIHLYHLCRTLVLNTSKLTIRNWVGRSAFFLNTQPFFELSAHFSEFSYRTFALTNLNNPRGSAHFRAFQRIQFSSYKISPHSANCLQNNALEWRRHLEPGGYVFGVGRWMVVVVRSYFCPVNDGYIWRLGRRWVGVNMVGFNSCRRIVYFIVTYATSTDVPWVLDYRSLLSISLWESILMARRKMRPKNLNLETIEEEAFEVLAMLVDLIALHLIL